MTDGENVRVDTDRGLVRIRVLRGHKALFDSDLAAAHGVAVKRLNEAVRRTPSRFPPDFIFRLTRQEFDNLRSQIATSSVYGK